MNGWLARLCRRWLVQLHPATSDHCHVELLEGRQLLSGLPALIRPLLPAPSVPQAVQRPLPGSVNPPPQLPALAPALNAVAGPAGALPVPTPLQQLAPSVRPTGAGVQLGIAQDLQSEALLNIALGGTGGVPLQVQAEATALGKGILGQKGGVNTNLGNDQGPPVGATVTVRASGSPGLSFDGRVPTALNLGPDPGVSGDVAVKLALPDGPDLGLHGSTPAGTDGGSGPGRNQEVAVHNLRSLVVMPAPTAGAVGEAPFARSGSPGPHPADDRNSGGREGDESGGAAGSLIGGVGDPPITNAALDAVFRSAGLGESEEEEIINVLALSSERPARPPDVAAAKGAEDQATPVPGDPLPSRGIGTEEWTLVDLPGDNPEGEGNQAVPAPGGLVDYAAFDLAALERAVQQFLAQMGQLDRELAQRGLYPWLVCLAATAVVYELTRRRAQRSAKGRALTTAAEGPLYPWRVGLAGLAPVA